MTTIRQYRLVCEYCGVQSTTFDTSFPPDLFLPNSMPKGWAYIIDKTPIKYFCLDLHKWEWEKRQNGK